MKQRFTPKFARAVAPFLCATAFVATPAFAQDAQTALPVVVTPPQSATVPPPPVVRTVPDAVTDAAPEATPAAEPAPRSAPRTVTRAATTRTTTTRTPVSSAAAAPAAEPVVPAEPQATTAPAAAPVAAPAAPAAPQVAADTAATQTQTTSTVPVWAWVGGGLAILAIALIGLFALRRRRADEAYYDEPYVDETVEETYVEPEYVEPVAVAPVAAAAAVQSRKEPEFLRRAEPAGEVEPVTAAAENVDIVEPEARDVAELTAAAPPVAERPWLEFAMRPVRAGTNVDEALVEIELTVGNAGSVPARDVRISTFLLSSDPQGTEMERLLVNPPADATTDPVTIQPGEGKRIDATLALLKSEMGENLPESFRPIVVADARYTLADGTEGRTSASFAVGVTPEDGEGIEPIGLSRASMHDNVAAELHGEPQHA